MHYIFFTWFCFCFRSNTCCRTAVWKSRLDEVRWTSPWARSGSEGATLRVVRPCRSCSLWPRKKGWTPECGQGLWWPMSLCAWTLPSWKRPTKLLWRSGLSLARVKNGSVGNIMPRWAQSQGNRSKILHLYKVKQFIGQLD